MIEWLASVEVVVRIVRSDPDELKKRVLCAAKKTQNEVVPAAFELLGSPKVTANRARRIRHARDVWTSTMVVPAEISWACNMGEVATVAAWLDSGNDPDEATADGDTLLFAAAERGGPDMIRTLIAKMSGPPAA